MFGTGPSWWYPERAAAFLKREGLPGNVFQDYGLGGYLTWRIGPEYPDFVDGRYIPFGNELFARADGCWLRSDRIPWNGSEQRTAGRSIRPFFPWLDTRVWDLLRCRISVRANRGSPSISTMSPIIFVRESPRKRRPHRQAGMRCESAPIAPPDRSIRRILSRQGRTFHLPDELRFDLFCLGARRGSRLHHWSQAEQIFPDDPNLHLVKAQMFAATNSH